MKARVLVVALIALLCVVAPAWAEKGDMKVQFGAVYTMPTDDLQEPGETLELDEAVGIQLSFEYMVADKIGIEPAITSSDHEVTVEESGLPEFKLGDIDYIAITGNVNFHVLGGEKFDLYVGPAIGYVLWGDLETDIFGQPETFSSDDEFTFGVNAGIDVPFAGKGWGFSASLSYMLTDVTLEGSQSDLGVDPIWLKAGLSYKF